MDHSERSSFQRPVPTLFLQSAGDLWYAYAWDGAGLRRMVVASDPLQALGGLVFHWGQELGITLYLPGEEASDE